MVDVCLTHCYNSVIKCLTKCLTVSKPSKFIGVRLPYHVWEALKEYGVQAYPSDEAKEGFEVTATVVNLICQGLGIVERSPNSQALNDVKQPLNTQPLNDVLQLLNNRVGSLETALSSEVERLNSQVEELKGIISQRQLPPLKSATGSIEDTRSRDGDEVQIVTNPTKSRSTTEPELSPLDSTETGTTETIMVTAFENSPRIDGDSVKVQTPSEVKTSGLTANIKGVNSSDASLASPPNLTEAIEKIVSMDDGVRLSHGKIAELLGVSKTSVFRVARGKAGNNSATAIAIETVGLKFDGEKWVKKS